MKFGETGGVPGTSQTFWISRTAAICKNYAMLFRIAGLPSENALYNHLNILVQQTDLKT
jgi:hypothetical protein